MDLLKALELYKQKSDIAKTRSNNILNIFCYYYYNLSLIQLNGTEYSMFVDTKLAKGIVHNQKFGNLILVLYKFRFGM